MAKTPHAPLARKPATAKRAPAPKPVKGGGDPAKAAKTGYVLEDQIGYRLRRAHQRASEIFNRVMAEFALTQTQFAALVKLHDEGPISQNHLSRLTGIDPATALGVVGRLSRQGLVHARPDPADGRASLLSLTGQGVEAVVTMKAIAIKVTRETLAPLSAAEAKVLVDLLARIG